MKLKKVTVLILIMTLLCTLFSSCSAFEDNIPLTEEESDAVAEYMAYLFLKNTASYDKALVTPTPTPTPRPTLPSASKNEQETEESVVSATPAADSNNSTATDSDNDKASGEENNEASPVPTPTEIPDPMSKATTEFSKLFNMEEVEITFLGSKNLDSFEGSSYDFENSKNGSGATDISASSGKTLLFASFELKNTSDKPVVVNLLEQDITFMLDINLGKIYKPLSTVLENDLAFLVCEIKPGEAKQAVLVFETEKDLEINTAHFMAMKGDDTAIIKVK